MRIISEETSSETIGAFLAQNRQENRSIAIVSALITIAFLGAYAASQLLAGSKALHVIFGWNYDWGIMLGAIIVFTYCFSGGIRASIWTDAIQSILMMVAMIMLFMIAIAACGGPGGLWQQLEAIDSTLIDPIPGNLQYGFGLFLLSWLAAGVGVVGQPHIMVRAMVINDVKKSASVVICTLFITLFLPQLPFLWD